MLSLSLDKRLSLSLSLFTVFFSLCPIIDTINNTFIFLCVFQAKRLIEAETVQEDKGEGDEEACVVHNDNEWGTLYMGNCDGTQTHTHA